MTLVRSLGMLKSYRTVWQAKQTAKVIILVVAVAFLFITIGLIFC